MIRRPPRSTQSRSSAASDVYKRQVDGSPGGGLKEPARLLRVDARLGVVLVRLVVLGRLGDLTGVAVEHAVDGGPLQHHGQHAVNTAHSLGFDGDAALVLS